MDRLQVEIREADGRDPMLYGIMLQEGRAASRSRRELFTPMSVQWPADGVGVVTEHLGKVESRGQVIRHRDGRLEVTAPATPAIVEAVRNHGKRFMSVEFVAVAQAQLQNGVREIRRALVDVVALTRNPEYRMTSAELREDDGDRREEQAFRWL
ncbi:MAG: hypothetical protein OXP73_01855 [Chloroflexota bacterium]|nr:hypothetical protein [Chloroflexota bacterium]